MQAKVSNPTTLYISFPGGCAPKMFQLNDASGKCYYFRYFSGCVPRIKVNIPDQGVYTGNVLFEVYKRSDIELPEIWPILPPAQRDRVRPLQVIDNSTLTGTPLRIFTDTGIVEVAPVFYSYPLPIQKFLLEHERGHLFYRDEDKCDLFALVNYLRMGYNACMGYYALAKILSVSTQNVQRLKENLKNIQKTQKQKIV